MSCHVVQKRVVHLTYDQCIHSWIRCCNFLNVHDTKSTFNWCYQSNLFSPVVIHVRHHVKGKKETLHTEIRVQQHQSCDWQNGHLWHFALWGSRLLQDFWSLTINATCISKLWLLYMVYDALTMALRSSNSRPIAIPWQCQPKWLNLIWNTYLILLHWYALPFQNLTFLNPAMCITCQQHVMNLILRLYL